MKAAMLRGQRSLAIEDVPAPTPKYGEVLVRVRATAICGTDISIYEGKTKVNYPRIIGHESAGEVVELGKGIRSSKVGDKVVMSPTSYCGACPACIAGSTNLCENGGLFGREIDGSFAEYVVLAENRVFKLPDSISLVEATTFAVLTTVVYAQRKINMIPGSSVVVIGEGPSGMLHTKLAKLRGSDPVIGVSRSQWKLDLAEKVYGADLTLRESEASRVLDLTGGRGADFVIESAGTAETLNLATELVRPGGTILAFGITPPAVEKFLSYALYFKDLTLIGSRAMLPADWPLSIKLAEKKMIDLGTIITHRLPLVELERGFILIKDRSKKALRVVIEI
ncbi:MAG: alcohol dehydrogenase catalytic domain-containing protein [Planctomycetes bacterium]|nr:alcohol dehydrogenase catalytic domain-containing protein [Planctomycetota bacterium]